MFIRIWVVIGLSNLNPRFGGEQKYRFIVVVVGVVDSTPNQGVIFPLESGG